MPEEVLTVAAAAELASVSRNVVLYAIQEKKLKAVLVFDSRGGRGKYEIKTSDLTRWIARRRPHW